MTKDILTFAGASLLALGLAAGPVAAQQNPVQQTPRPAGERESMELDNQMAQWDKDGSGIIDRTEWDESFDNRGAYDRWDSNRDGTLSRDEFNQGVYTRYDRDQSGDMNDDEWSLWEEDASDNGIFGM